MALEGRNSQHCKFPSMHGVKEDCWGLPFQMAVTVVIETTTSDTNTDVFLYYTEGDPLRNRLVISTDATDKGHFHPLLEILKRSPV
jgi:hypothetical protein